MKEAGKRARFFRFSHEPYRDTREKHDALAAFLAERGIPIGTCTIDNSDFVFNAAYVGCWPTKTRHPPGVTRGIPGVHEHGNRVLCRPETNKFWGSEPPQVDAIARSIA